MSQARRKVVSKKPGAVQVLKIDMRELCWALDDSSLTIERYLDLETGDIVELFEFDDLDPDEDGEEMEDTVREMVDENPGRFAFIDPLPSFESYRHMEDYIQTVKDPHLRDLLTVAIDGKGAFRRFKNVLLNYPDEEAGWFEFKDEKMLLVAMDYLDSIGVEPAAASSSSSGDPA